MGLWVDKRGLGLCEVGSCLSFLNSLVEPSPSSIALQGPFGILLLALGSVEGFRV